MINRKAFFAAVRKTVFKGGLSPSAVANIDIILDEWERQRLKDLRWLGYMLSTTRGECGSKMAPVREIGRGKGKKYGKKVNGHVYYGRGYVQLTWYENYVKMGKLLRLPLADNPDLALRPDIAVKIMFEGMLRGVSLKGDFTGKSLEDYFTASKSDWKGARKIVNGTDRAAQFATWGQQFYAALKASDDGKALPPSAGAKAAKDIAGPLVVGTTTVAAGKGWFNLPWGEVAVIAGVAVVVFLVWWHREAVMRLAGKVKDTVKAWFARWRGKAPAAKAKSKAKKKVAKK